jgi:hypothetical protein
MQHLSDYSDAYDAAAEKEAAREAAIADRENEIINDRFLLRDAIADASFDAAPPSEADYLAGLWVSEFEQPPDWFSPSLHVRNAEGLRNWIERIVRERATNDIDVQRREGSGG